eukprot:1585699-Rhodomonas_salina.2
MLPLARFPGTRTGREDPLAGEDSEFFTAKSLAVILVQHTFLECVVKSNVRSESKNKSPLLPIRGQGGGERAGCQQSAHNTC